MKPTQGWNYRKGEKVVVSESCARMLGPVRNEADAYLFCVAADLLEEAEALCEAIMQDLGIAPVNRIPNIAYHRQNLMILIKKAKGLE